MKPTGYLSVAEAALRWGVSVRRVQDYCVAGRVSGAEKWGRAWMIPMDTARPQDGRRGGAAAQIPFIRECPIITMTDLLTRPGCADDAARSLGDSTDAALFSAYLKYLRGDADAALAGAQGCMGDGTGFYAQISAGTLMSLCAMNCGNGSMWRDAMERIRSAPCRHRADRNIRDFWLAAADSAIYGDGGYPEWFIRGDLSPLPADSQGAARFFYVKHLYVESASALVENGKADAERVHRVRFLPHIAEPLIAQTRMEGVYVAEIYLRLICAVCCHVTGDDDRASEHIDRAISLALPDRFFAPFAEYETNLDFLMDDRLRRVDENAYHAVKRINRRMNEGWVALHNRELMRSVSASLTTRERETARLAVMGLNNREIADRQRVSVSTVKQSLRSAMSKTGAQNRAGLAKYI